MRSELIRRATSISSCALILFSLFCSASLAAPITVELIGYAAGDDPANGQSFQTSFEPNPDDTFNFQLDQQPAGTIWQLDSLTVSGDIDPIAALGFAVTNVTAGPVEFIMNVTVPIAPTLPATRFGGSASFTIDNSNSDADATISTNAAGDPLYAGQIDGSTVLPLFPAAFSVTTPAIDQFADFAGLPGPSIAGPAATTIGIEVNFALTAGDSVSATTNFIVEIPEPASGLMLLAMGTGWSPPDAVDRYESDRTRSPHHVTR